MITEEEILKIGFVYNSNYHPEGKGYKKRFGMFYMYYYPLYKMIDASSAIPETYRFSKRYSDIKSIEDIKEVENKLINEI